MISVITFQLSTREKGETSFMFLRLILAFFVSLVYLSNVSFALDEESFISNFRNQCSGVANGVLRVSRKAGSKKYSLLTFQSSYTEYKSFSETEGGDVEALTSSKKSSFKRFWGEGPPLISDTFSITFNGVEYIYESDFFHEGLETVTSEKGKRIYTYAFQEELKLKGPNNQYLYLQPNSSLIINIHGSTCKPLSAQSN